MWSCEDIIIVDLV